MTAKDIQKLLDKKFDSHKYILHNSYVFDWESDFFSMTASGYFIELEIKTNLADYNRDFTKVLKHKAIQKKFNGEKTWIVEDHKNFEIEYIEYKTLVVDGKRQYDEDGNIIKTAETKIKQLKTWSEEKRIKQIYKEAEVTQLYTAIRIEPPPRIPHKLYYICPKDIIPLELIPPYAGLYYVYESGQIREIKKAPFIHKEDLDLTKILLDKFYYKSLNKKSP